jgi:hypothetical protein
MVGVFGESTAATGLAGDGVSTPALNIFGPNSIASGFILETDTIVPEPSTIGVCVIGAGLILFRPIRRKNLICPRSKTPLGFWVCCRIIELIRAGSDVGDDKG